MVIILVDLFFGAPARTGSSLGGCFVTKERTRTRQVSQRCIKHPAITTNLGHYPNNFNLYHIRCLMQRLGGHRAVRLNSACPGPVFGLRPSLLHAAVRSPRLSSEPARTSKKPRPGTSPHIAPIPGASWHTTSCARMMNIELRILIYDFGSPTVNMKGVVSFRRM